MDIPFSLHFGKFLTVLSLLSLALFTPLSWLGSVQKHYFQLVARRFTFLQMPKYGNSASANYFTQLHITEPQQALPTHTLRRLVQYAYILTVVWVYFFKSGWVLKPANVPDWIKYNALCMRWIGGVSLVVSFATGNYSLMECIGMDWGFF